MSKKNELKFVFHNPNTPKDTEEYLSRWLASLCMPSIEKLVFESKASGVGHKEKEKNQVIKSGIHCHENGE